jgi:hypothetical protein
MPHKTRPLYPRDSGPVRGIAWLSRARRCQIVITPFAGSGTIGYIRVNDPREYRTRNDQEQAGVKRGRKVTPQSNGNIRFQAVLEAPIPVLVVVAVLVTLAVFITALDVI